MKKFIRLLPAVLAITGVIALVPVQLSYAGPADQIKTGVGDVGGGGKDCKDDKGNAIACTLGDQVKTVVNILLYMLGAIAVVMIVIGGIRYATSNGESSSIKSAKDTILYAVIGLVVAIMAYAIVNFVLTAFKS